MKVMKIGHISEREEKNAARCLQWKTERWIKKEKEKQGGVLKKADNCKRRSKQTGGYGRRKRIAGKIRQKRISTDENRGQKKKRVTLG